MSVAFYKATRLKCLITTNNNIKNNNNIHKNGCLSFKPTYVHKYINILVMHTNILSKPIK